MVNFLRKDEYTLYDMVKIVTLLRSENGCPWDREQTHESIRRNFIEEVCEACEAIDQKDSVHLREELGDVLMQVLFHADIERQAGNFDIEGVADAACKKLIERHPHVFGDTTVNSSEQVLDNWDSIKRRQNKHTTHTQAMDSVARTLPALWRAEKIQSKAKKAGFDWPDIQGALDKLMEEVEELQTAVRQGHGAEEELGDVLFSAVNVARFLKVDPEEILTRATDKFLKRFSQMESMLGEQDMSQLGINELDKLWEKAKEKDLLP